MGIRLLPQYTHHTQLEFSKEGNKETCLIKKTYTEVLHEKSHYSLNINEKTTKENALNHD